MVFPCKGGHGSETGKTVAACPLRHTVLVIQMPEFVKAHQVKGVYQPITTGVRGMVRVEKFPVVVYDCSACRRTACECVAARCGRFLIYAG